MEPLNEASKEGKSPLCDHFSGAGVNTPAAKWLHFPSGTGEALRGKHPVTLFVQLLDETGLFQLRDEGVVDELLRFRFFSRGIDGEV